MEQLSLSVLRSRNSLLPKAIPTNQNAAPLVANPEKQSVMEMVVLVPTGHSAKCFPRYVPSVARKLKCRLSPAKVDQCTAVNVTIKSD